MIIGLGLITHFSLSLGEEDDDGHEEVHGVFPEDVAADGLTERLLPLVDQLLQSVSEWKSLLARLTLYSTGMS